VTISNPNFLFSSASEFNHRIRSSDEWFAEVYKSFLPCMQANAKYKKKKLCLISNLKKV
jgi:hypothetical protein